LLKNDCEDDDDEDEGMAVPALSWARVKPAAALQAAGATTVRRVLSVPEDNNE